MENKNNVIVIILVVIIAILCSVIGWLVGSKFALVESDVINESNNSEEKVDNEKNEINFIGDKNTEVTYNPSYAPKYNLNYKINENNELVYTDKYYSDKTMTYSSIQGDCQYIVMSIPHGKQEPLYEIAVITTQGDVYYKVFYAFAEITDENMSKYASMNDNFKKVESNINFNGISVRNNVVEAGDFQTIIISDVNNNEYYITRENFENITLNKLN